MNVNKNALINIVGSVLPIIVMLVTVPAYLKVVGDARYGVLSLVWLMIGYFTFMEIGLGKATAHQVAQEEVRSKRSEIFWTAIAINIALGSLASVLLYFFSEYLISHVLKMPNEFRFEALQSLPWLIATFPLALVSSVLNGSLEGANKFYVLNVIQVIGSIVFQVIPLLVAIFWSPSLEYVIPAAVITRSITNLFMIYMCHVYVTDRSAIVFSKSRIKLLFTFGGWVGVSSLVTPTLETVDRLIIGATVGAKAVSYYTIAHQVVGKLKIFPGAYFRAIFPQVSGSKDKHSDAIYGLLSLLSLMTPIVILVALSLKIFLDIWIGSRIAGEVVNISYILLFGVWVNGVAHVPMAMMMGSGRPDVVAKIHLIEIVPFVFLLYFSAIHFGVLGVALAWVSRVTIDAILMFYISGLIKKSKKYLFIYGLFVIIFLIYSYALDGIQNMIYFKTISILIVLISITLIYRNNICIAAKYFLSKKDGIKI